MWRKGAGGLNRKKNFFTSRFAARRNDGFLERFTVYKYCRHLFPLIFCFSSFGFLIFSTVLRHVLSEHTQDRPFYLISVDPFKRKIINGFTRVDVPCSRVSIVGRRHNSTANWYTCTSCIPTTVGNGIRFNNECVQRCRGQRQLPKGVGIAFEKNRYFCIRDFNFFTYILFLPALGTVVYIW